MKYKKRNKRHENRRRGKLLISVTSVLISRICITSRKFNIYPNSYNLFVIPGVSEGKPFIIQ